MLIVSADLEDAALRAGQSVDARERDIISSIVFVANLLVMGLPLLQSLVTSPLPARVAAFVVESLNSSRSSEALGPMPSQEEGLATTALDAMPAAAAAQLSLQELDTPSEAAHMPIEVRFPPQAALCIDGSVLSGPLLWHDMATDSEPRRGFT